MRVREIKNLLDNYNKQIGVSVSHVPHSNRKTVLNLQKSLDAINELSKLGFLDDDIERFKDIGSIYYSRVPEDKIEVDNHIDNQITNHIKIVKEKLRGFGILIDQSVSDQNENVISVKLPQYNSLEELEKFIKKLNNAFQNGITLEEINGHYKLQGFDTGSMWIDILVNSSAAVIFVGQLIDAAINISKRSQELLITKANIEKLALQNEQLKLQVETSKALLDGIEKGIDTITDAEIKNVTEGANYSTESIGHIKQSVKIFAELLHEGTQFHPSLDAPSETVEAFPEPQKNLEEPQQLLETLADNLPEQE